jgi:hypothetical protein
MTIFSNTDAIDPQPPDNETRRRLFRMRLGRIRIEIDLDLTTAESEVAQRYIDTVIHGCKQPSRTVVSPLPNPPPENKKSPKLSKAIEFYLDNLAKRKRGVSVA